MIRHEIADSVKGIEDEMRVHLRAQGLHSCFRDQCLELCFSSTPLCIFFLPVQDVPYCRRKYYQQCYSQQRRVNSLLSLKSCLSESHLFLVCRSQQGLLLFIVKLHLLPCDRTLLL